MTDVDVIQQAANLFGMVGVIIALYVTLPKKKKHLFHVGQIFKKIEFLGLAFGLWLEKKSIFCRGEIFEKN